MVEKLLKKSDKLQVIEALTDISITKEKNTKFKKSNC